MILDDYRLDYEDTEFSWLEFWYYTCSGKDHPMNNDELASRDDAIVLAKELDTIKNPVAARRLIRRT